MLTKYKIKINLHTNINQATCFFDIIGNCVPFTISICKQPTDQTNVSSIAYINNILTLINQEDRIDVLKKCYELYNLTPDLIFIDVRCTLYTKLITEIEKTFNVTYKQQYTSTNGSEMCMFLITLEPPHE